jgi:type I restriction enzyme R subunit
MRGSSERAFIACTVDLLEAAVDIERLNAVVFFRYLQSPIKFYQMVGRGTRIHEESGKYKFWLYDYTDVTSLFGTELITKPSRSGGGGGGGDDGGGGDGGGEGSDGPAVGEVGGKPVVITAQGRFIVVSRDGRETLMPVEEYRREVVSRVLSEAHTLEEFRALWIEPHERRQFIEHLLGERLDPDLIRDEDRMNDFDLYDYFSHHGYHARALRRRERGNLFVTNNQPWFAAICRKTQPLCSRASAISSPKEAPTRWKPRRFGRCRLSRRWAGWMRCVPLVHPCR